MGWFDEMNCQEHLIPVERQCWTSWNMQGVHHFPVGLLCHLGTQLGKCQQARLFCLALIGGRLCPRYLYNGILGTAGSETWRFNGA